MSPRRGLPSIFSSPQPLVFAHRGGAKLAPENTLAAFERGLACGADGIECDVHLARDGVPVVFHDGTLDRTTNASGRVAALTAAELAGVDAGYHFPLGGGFPFRGRGIGVPTLERVLVACPARTIVELKHGDPELARAVVDVLRRTGAAERVCVGSFYRRGVARIRAEAPEIATSASELEVRRTLYLSWIRCPVFGQRPYDAFQVPEWAGRLRLVTPAFVRRVHAEGATVQVWVIDAPADIQRLLTWGVDGIISDRPDIAIAERDAWVKKNL